MPDQARAQAQYSRHAEAYDRTEDRVVALRRRAVAELRLQRGDTVLDVGCGTGLSFRLLEEGVGPGGGILGIDQSPEMPAQARARMEASGWHNVTLIEAPAASAMIPAQADAALFHFTHDILRTPEAVANVVGHLKPGGRVVAIGIQWAPWWRLDVNLVVARLARAYTTTFEGLRAPWTHLGTLIPDLEVERLMAGGVYLAGGSKPGSLEAGGRGG